MKIPQMPDEIKNELYNYKKPRTNADRIRAMSNYDLANIIDCPNQQRFNDGCKKWHDCHDCKMEWLEKDASHADP